MLWKYFLECLSSSLCPLPNPHSSEYTHRPQGLIQEATIRKEIKSWDSRKVIIVNTRCPKMNDRLPVLTSEREMKQAEKVSEKKSVCNLSLIEYGTANNDFSAHHLLRLFVSSFFLSYRFMWICNTLHCLDLVCVKMNTC